jgi:membrane-anchored protein YejM (alkaline phosphatase superfamily)
MITVRKRINTLTKALGKHILPEKVVRDYRKRMNRQNIKKNVVIITMDSCRYDVFQSAYEEDFPAKNVRKAYSQSNWTLPSHESIVRGFLPHGDFVNPLENIGYSLGLRLPRQHEYSFAATAMPYLSESRVTENSLHECFDNYYCAEKANSSEDVLRKAEKFINPDKNFFALINLGETHLPYHKFKEIGTKDMLEKIESGNVSKNEAKNLQQKRAKELIDQLNSFIEKLPDNTLIIVTGDHGDLLGEGGGYGHNPNLKAKFHQKLFEVPLLYWYK